MSFIMVVRGGSGGGGTVHNSLSGLEGVGPEFIHLSQVEYNTLLSSVEQRFGVAAIGTSTVVLTVTFGTPFIGSPDYNVSFSFSNDVDPAPNALTGMVIQRTLTQMTIEIAGEVDTGNYKMFWRAYR